MSGNLLFYIQYEGQPPFEVGTIQVWATDIVEAMQKVRANCPVKKLISVKDMMG